MSAIWVIGAGGQAKLVIDALRAARAGTIAGVLDDDPRLWGTEVLGVPIVATAAPEAVVRHAARWAVLAIGDNRLRAEVARRLAGHVEWVRVVHPAAHVADAHIGAGSVVLAGAVVQPDAVVGAHTILNTACSVDHDGRVGDFAHVGPGAARRPRHRRRGGLPRCRERRYAGPDHRRLGDHRRRRGRSSRYPGRCHGQGRASAILRLRCLSKGIGSLLPQQPGNTILARPSTRTAAPTFQTLSD